MSRVLKVSLPPRRIGDITIGELPVLPRQRQPCHQSVVLVMSEVLGWDDKGSVDGAYRCGGLP